MNTKWSISSCIDDKLPAVEGEEKSFLERNFFVSLYRTFALCVRFALRYWFCMFFPFLYFDSFLISCKYVLSAKKLFSVFGLPSTPTMFVYVKGDWSKSEAEKGIKELYNRMVNCECYERQRKEILWLNIGLDLKILCLMTQKKTRKTWWKNFNDKLYRIFEVGNSRRLSNISRIFN